MGNEIQHQTTSIRDHGAQHEARCGDLLREARYLLNGEPRKAATAAFTMYGFELAMSHTLAIEWADEDLKTKAEQLADFRQRLNATAACHDATEQRNTLKI
ncbi:hypothetical protein Acsp03_57750 [Actinomadura sp. NBRC 104412]|uniref:hypothetical protein n=1 Tax=Actinomadura sp. NBRC 104412 TaxID=3032203 RepID=UPI0024A53A53|nr:hypothetical protein [Actinomadura sp. NBRC 104412]GLZ08309.1 hypothetical protein Acsp03_57750 [Actinomadura sp. NBRC 104412]